MSDFNVSGLSPEEKQQLIAMLQQEDSPMEAGAEAGNPDAEQDESLIRAIIAETLGPISQKVDLLHELVVNGIIGGVEELAKQKELLAEYDRVKSSYSSADDADDEGPGFNSGDVDFFKDTAPEGGTSDLFEALRDEIMKAKGGSPDWGDEQEVPLVKTLKGTLRGKLAKYRGAGTEEAAPVAAEVTKVEATPAEGAPGLDKVLKNIRSLKKSGVKTGY